MLIYNTTYHVEDGDARNFLIWMTQHYIPTVLQSGLLSAPRLAEVLSHREDGTSTYTLQWEVESSKTLHEWHTRQGNALNEELLKIFKDKVVGFPTLLEVMDLPDYD